MSLSLLTCSLSDVFESDQPLAVGDVVRVIEQGGREGMVGEVVSKTGNGFYYVQFEGIPEQY